MNLTYIGQYQPGSTSRMRGEILADILRPENLNIIDIAQIISGCNRLSTSIGWRYFTGPMVSEINQIVRERIEKLEQQDLIWVDKAVFLSEKTSLILRNKSTKMIHYTPDAAFAINRSYKFYKALPLYDLCVTTKSFEVNSYMMAGARKVFFCTQGYEPEIHKPYHSFDQKEGVGFVGLAEKSRIEAIEYLIENGVDIRLAGKGWQYIINKYGERKNFCFVGEAIYGEDYGRFLSGLKMAIGFLSKRFPEMHTTRTFEIPACGTALLTEKNSEISGFFNDNEAVFYSDKQDLLSKIRFFYDNELLDTISGNGRAAVVKGAYSYIQIIQQVLNNVS